MRVHGIWIIEGLLACKHRRCIPKVVPSCSLHHPIFIPSRCRYWLLIIYFPSFLWHSKYCALKLTIRLERRLMSKLRNLSQGTNVLHSYLLNRMNVAVILKFYAYWIVLNWKWNFPGRFCLLGLVISCYVWYLMLCLMDLWIGSWCFGPFRDSRASYLIINLFLKLLKGGPNSKSARWMIWKTTTTFTFPHLF